MDGDLRRKSRPERKKQTAALLAFQALAGLFAGNLRVGLVETNFNSVPCRAPKVKMLMMLLQSTTWPSFTISILAWKRPAARTNMSAGRMWIPIGLTTVTALSITCGMTSPIHGNGESMQPPGVIRMAARQCD